MSELERIAAALHCALHNGSRALLATVVGSEGSTYRKIGARMVITPEREVIGAISGGCLEADIIDRWDALFEAGTPQIVTYDTRSADDRFWGYGLGCNGRIDVLLEPLADDALERARDCFERALELEDGVLATIIATRSETFALGDRFLVGRDGALVANVSDVAGLPAEASAMLRDGWSVIATGRARRRSRSVSGTRVDVLWEPIRHAPRLTICGGGADSRPLATLAAKFGWKVQVMDHRPAFARAGDFPAAARVALVGPGGAAATLQDAAADAVVVMSHHFDRDLEYLAAALASDAPYVGLLGPRARRDRLLAELAAMQPGLGPAIRDRLYAPIGLDLGADTPEEIAFAIVAELMAVARGRPGGSLRARREAIHERLGSRSNEPRDWGRDVQEAKP